MKPDEETVSENDAVYQATADLDRQDILFLRHAPAALAELRSLEDVSDAVTRARDKAMIAIYDRLRRAVRRDIPFG